jgi:Dolichyl-phosphate-mannose-protein mannosyltransferase
VRALALVLPFVGFALLCARFLQRSGSWRASILRAATACGVALLIITELLSFFRLLSLAWLLASWVAAFLVMFARVRARSNAPERPNDGATAPWSADGWTLSLLLGLALIVLATGVIAIVAPPNTWDAMVYHMPRVMHWIQNGSVANYPTNIPRQLYLTPWAEFAILHAQILSGGDHFANLVQWLAMIGSLLGVSLIAQQLGGDARSQVFAAVVCATIPMGILQASSTQNDYVVTFWLVCFAYHVCRFLRHEDSQLEHGWWMGANLGLALLTKPTAYVFALPFLAWMLLEAGRRRRRDLWKTVATIGLLAFMLNAGHYDRMVRLYGSPLGPGREGPHTLANESFGASTLASNVARNIALHVGTPNENINRAIESWFVWFHQKLGTDINDPKITWLGTRLRITKPSLHEDSAGNFTHTVLIALNCTSVRPPSSCSYESESMPLTGTRAERSGRGDSGGRTRLARSAHVEGRLSRGAEAANPPRPGQLPASLPCA